MGRCEGQVINEGSAFSPKNVWRDGKRTTTKKKNEEENGLMLICSGMGVLVELCRSSYSWDLHSLSGPCLFLAWFSKPSPNSVSLLNPSNTFLLGFSEPECVSATYPKTHHSKLTPLCCVRSGRDPQTLCYLPKDPRLMSGGIALGIGVFWF